MYACSSLGTMQCLEAKKNSSEVPVPRLAICERTSRKWLSERCLDRSNSRSLGQLDGTASEAASAVRYLPYEGQLKVMASINFIRSGLMRAHVQISDGKDLPPAPPGVSSEIQICLFKDEEIFMCQSVPIKRPVGIDLPTTGSSLRNIAGSSVSTSARLLISVYWQQSPYGRHGTTFVKSCMSFTLRPCRPINDWFYLLDPEVGQLKHLRAAQQHLVGSLPPPAATPPGLSGPPPPPPQPGANVGLAPESKVNVRQRPAASLRQLRLSAVQTAAASRVLQQQPVRPPMCDVTNLSHKCPTRPSLKSAKTSGSVEMLPFRDDRLPVPSTAADCVASVDLVQADSRCSRDGGQSLVSSELPQFETVSLQAVQSRRCGEETLRPLQCIAVMQDGLTLEDRETRSAGMLQPSVGISCGLVALGRCSTSGCAAATAPEPATAEDPLDASTAGIRSTIGAASAPPDSERLHSRVPVGECLTSESSIGVSSNGSSSDSSSSTSSDASCFRAVGASCTTPPTSPLPSKVVAMFTIGEDAPSWGGDDPKESAELQPSRANAGSSSACPATTIVASRAGAAAPPGSSAALDGSVSAAATEAAAQQPDLLPPFCSGKRFATAASPGGVLSSQCSKAVACAHTNGSLLLPRQHSLQEVCFLRASSSGEPSIPSFEEGAECAAARSLVTSTISSACYGHGRRLKHRSKQRCSSDSSSGSTEETEGAVACAARRQFEAMLPLRLAMGSTMQPVGSCDCSVARSAEVAAAANVDADATAAATQSKQRHRAPLLSRKSCSAISSDDGGGSHHISPIGDRQPPPQQQPQSSASGGGGKAFGRISSAVELAGTAKKSWQRSAATFGRSKSLVCTSGPVGHAQPLSAAAAPPHALFLADASPRNKSHEAWRSQTGTGEKRNTFRKIARNVRNMMALLRIQKPHRSASGTSAALSSSPPPGCAQVTLEMAEHWASSFSLLLANKEGVDLFRSFLHSEYSEENIEFWMACEEYRSTKAASTAKLQAKAQAIFSRFVAPHAPKEVNLDSKTRLETESNLEQPDCNAFESAKQRIQCLMEKDSYPRFLRSPLYMELVEHLRTAAAASGGTA